MPPELRSKWKTDKVVFEKCGAEELPPGWTKEVRIRTNGSKSRKDPYYTDPVTGYQFRSLKDVHRYLKTGELGRLAIKPKDNSNVDTDAKDEKLPTQSQTDEHKLPDEATDDHVAGQQSSKLDGVKDDEDMVESTDMDNRTYVPQNASESCVENAAGSDDLPEANGLEEIECKEDAAVNNVNLPQAHGPEESEGKKNAVVSRVNLPESNGSEERESMEGNPESNAKPLVNIMEGREEESESKEQTAALRTPLSGTPQHKRPLENGLEGHKKRIKSIEKSKPALPRRASKRLAGIEVDVPPLEPEPKTRRQSTARRAREAEPSTSTNLATPREHDKEEVGITSCQKKVGAIALSEANASTPGEHVEECETDREVREKQGNILPPASEHGQNADMDNQPDNKQEIPTLLPPENLATISKTCKKVEHEDIKADEKQKLPFVLPPVTHSSLDIKVDEKQKLPFVLPPVTHSSLKDHDGKIQTHKMPKEKQGLQTTFPPVSLTSPEVQNSRVKVDNDATSGKQLPPIVAPPVSLEIEMDKKPPREKQKIPFCTFPPGLPIPEDSCGGVKTDNKADIKPELPVSFSLNDLWSDPCIEFAVKTLTGAIPIEEKKVESVQPPPVELPLEELWNDPCIEFAVKTLTGAIPIGEDICVQDYLQHQPTSSSDTRGDNSFSQPDAGINSFSQTEVLSTHFEMAEHSLHIKQQDLIVPRMLPAHHINGGLQNSGNSALHQQVKRNSNGECSRPRFFQ